MQYKDKLGVYRVGDLKFYSKLEAIEMKKVSEIAVFADVESMFYVSEFAKLNHDCLRNMRDILGRIGAPYDIYNFSDLSKITLEKYKLCIFLNTFKISDENKRIIEERVKKQGRSILWIYAPNYINDNGFSVRDISNIVDINIEEAAIKGSEVESEGISYGFTEQISPLFCVKDKEAVSLGKYSEDNSIALAYKKQKEYTTYYSAVGNIPYSILRNIAINAGVHMYFDGQDPVYVNNRLIGIHSVVGGEVVLKLPFDTSVEELFDGGIYETKNQELKITIPKGEMKLYLLNRY